MSIRHNWKIRCDFDNTISDRDTCDFVLENFADPKWQDIEIQWKNNEIDSNICMVGQAALLNTTPEKIAALLDQVKIDPYFTDFLKTCQHWQVPVQILSDGYDFNINTILAKNNLSYLDIAANSLKYLGNNKFQFTSLHMHGKCRSGYSACKCGEMKTTFREVLIGDGRSDFCAALSADLVIAKDSLLDFCRRKGLPHVAFRDFADVTHILSRVFMEEGGRRNNNAAARANNLLHVVGEIE